MKYITIEPAAEVKYCMRTAALLLMLLVLANGAAAYELNIDYTGAILSGTEGGRETWKKPDGTVIVKHPDREEAVLRDKTRIVRFRNGNREIFAPDGVEIRIRYDGETRYRYPDGTEKVFSMDGLTPYGLAIKEQRDLVRRRDFSVEVIYSSRFSDNILERRMKGFYREFLSQVRKRVDAGRVPKMRMRMVISNCRFCKTGYCRRKNKKEITITSFISGKKDRELSVLHADILSPKGRDAEAAKAAEALLTGRVRP